MNRAGREFCNRAQRPIAWIPRPQATLAIRYEISVTTNRAGARGPGRRSSRGCRCELRSTTTSCANLLCKLTKVSCNGGTLQLRPHAPGTCRASFDFGNGLAVRLRDGWRVAGKTRGTLWLTSRGGGLFVC